MKPNRTAQVSEAKRDDDVDVSEMLKTEADNQVYEGRLRTNGGSKVVDLIDCVHTDCLR